MKIQTIMLIIGLGISQAGCEQSLDEKASSKNMVAKYDRTKVASIRLEQGKTLFVKNCAVCHGIDAQGAENWRKRDKDGKFPPPPLNGSAHAWHHPKQALMYTIKNGTIALGGSMPAWKDKLTDEEIESIIYWFQAKWPDQLYQAWVRRDQESKKPR